MAKTLLFALLLIAAGLARAVDQPPPNIVFILADDIGWHDVGFANESGGFMETPNLDRLRRESMRFPTAYAAAANCQPSRGCLLTGQYTPRHGIYAVASTARGPMAQARLIPVPNTQDLKPEFVTMAEALKARGYATAHFGKWQIGTDAHGTGPRQQGFDVSDPALIPPEHEAGQPGKDDPKKMNAITEEACRFIEENRGRPFFAYLAHHAIHTPLEANPATLARFRAKAEGFAQPHVSPLYAACTYDFDASVGQLLDRIGQLGLAERTLVIFTSDNGGTPASLNEPLRGAKGAYYEAGVREPFLARWPGVIAPGSTCEVPIDLVDLYPTFLAAAGAPELPASLDGANLLPLFRGGSTLPRQALYWYFPGYLNTPVPRGRDPVFRTRPVSVIRKGDWKLLLYLEEWLLDGGQAQLDTNHAVELYNLHDDPGERHDLAESDKPKRDELVADLQAWWQKTQAPMPQPAAHPLPPAARRTGDGQAAAPQGIPNAAAANRLFNED